MLRKTEGDCIPSNGVNEELPNSRMIASNSISSGFLYFSLNLL